MLNVVFFIVNLFLLLLLIHANTNIQFMPTHTPFMKLLLQHKSVKRATKKQKNVAGKQLRRKINAMNI